MWLRQAITGMPLVCGAVQNINVPFDCTLCMYPDHQSQLTLTDIQQQQAVLWHEALQKSAFIYHQEEHILHWW